MLDVGAGASAGVGCNLGCSMLVSASECLIMSVCDFHLVLLPSMTTKKSNEFQLQHYQEQVIGIEIGDSISSFNNKDDCTKYGEESLKVLSTWMQPQIRNDDEERESQKESHVVFIPNWCLESSDDDFLCGEDIPIHELPIVEVERPVDEIIGMKSSG